MIIDQLEDIDSSKFVLEDESQLSDINKEIARYYCLNARVTWENSIWHLIDKAFYQWVVFQLIQRCTLSFQSSKLLFQLAFHIHLMNVFNSLLHDESNWCFNDLFQVDLSQENTQRKKIQRDRWTRREWWQWCRRARARHMRKERAMMTSSSADSDVDVDATLTTSRSDHRSDDSSEANEVAVTAVSSDDSDE